MSHGAHKTESWHTSDVREFQKKKRAMNELCHELVESHAHMKRDE